MIVGSGGKSVGYLAHGTATDYMFEKLGVPVTFTWEIYGDEKVRIYTMRYMYAMYMRYMYDIYVMYI